MSGWIALHIHLPVPREDEILLALDEAGTLGVRVQDSEAAEPPALAADIVSAEDPKAMRTATAYFGREIDLAPLIARLSAMGAGLVLGTSEVEDEPWVETQERSRKPLAIGRRFLILQRSQETPPDSVSSRTRAQEERTVLVIPPRRAFGTGEHATTRQCLELLESTHVLGRTVLDAGTGSGILAMAAATLGASSVRAIDNDPEAVEIARETLALNGFLVESSPPAGETLLKPSKSCDALQTPKERPVRSPGGASVEGAQPERSRGITDLSSCQYETASIAQPRGSLRVRGRARVDVTDRRAPIDLRLEDLSSLSGRFSVILANIHVGALEVAAASLAALQSGGDHLILSGFSPEEASSLGRLYAGLGYAQEARLESGEWAAIRLTRTH